MSKKVGHVSSGILLLVVGLIGALYVGRVIFGPPAIGPIAGTVTKSNGRFVIRVERHAEDFGGLLPGAYYIFKSAPIGSREWQNIMTVRRDDPLDILEDQVRFVNADIGYVFMGAQFAVTTDGGRSWVKRESATAIEDISLTHNGTGAMKIYGGVRSGPREFCTPDYGKTWYPRLPTPPIEQTADAAAHRHQR